MHVATSPKHRAHDHSVLQTGLGGKGGTYAGVRRDDNIFLCIFCNEPFTQEQAHGSDDNHRNGFRRDSRSHRRVGERPPCWGRREHCHCGSRTRGCRLSSHCAFRGRSCGVSEASGACAALVACDMAFVNTMKKAMSHDPQSASILSKDMVQKHFGHWSKTNIAVLCVCIIFVILLSCFLASQANLKKKGTDEAGKKCNVEQSNNMDWVIWVLLIGIVIYVLFLFVKMSNIKPPPLPSPGDHAEVSLGASAHPSTTATVATSAHHVVSQSL